MDMQPTQREGAMTMFVRQRRGLVCQGRVLVSLLLLLFFFWLSAQGIFFNLGWRLVE